MSIPRFNVEKIKMLRHSNQLRIKKLRAALNTMSSSEKKYNMMVVNAVSGSVGSCPSCWKELTRMRLAQTLF